MDSIKKRKEERIHSKKDKKLKKLINKSDSDSDESEHELSYYLTDRVKLMKEVLKIIKPKKIKSMAPDCMKKLDNEEINSMLLEELLGISNKRLKYIFNGQNLEEDSSSTDSEAEQQPIDVISLDDITDDDFIIDLDSDNDTGKKRHKKHKLKIKEEGKRKKIKKEKQDKTDHKATKKSKGPEKDKMDEQNLMSVLELLELQARARAIKSQIALESNRKAQEQEKNNHTKTEEFDNDDADAIIIESPKNIEIIITSSESENEDGVRNKFDNQRNTSECNTIGNDNKNSINNQENGSKKSISASEHSIEGISNSTREENSARQVIIDNENSDQLISRSDNEKNVSESANKDSEDGIGKPEDEDMEKGNKPSDDKKCIQTKNKIINIETVILTPPKNSVQISHTENDKEIEKGNENCQKNNTDKATFKEIESEGKTEKNKCKKRKPTSKREETVNIEIKGNSKKPDICNPEIGAIDEGDGIIINMEQSEIDCIISD